MDATRESSHDQSAVRAVARAVALVGWTLVSLMGIMALNGVVALHDRGVVEWPDCVAWRDRGVGAWAKGCIAILGVHTTVRGEVPEPPFFLVANHLSYLDVILLMHVTPCVFVAKSDVRGWPAVGFLAAMGGTVFIDRAAHRDILRVNDTLEAALDRGQGVVVFPEGTSSKGDTVLPFRASLLAPLAGTERPVYTASLSYRTPPGAPPAETHVCWWGDMTFADHVWGLLQLPFVDASVAFSRRRAVEEDRKALAASLGDEVRAHFVPVGTEGGRGPTEDETRT